GIREAGDAEAALDEGTPVKRDLSAGLPQADVREFDVGAGVAADLVSARRPRAAVGEFTGVGVVAADLVSVSRQRGQLSPGHESRPANRAAVYVKGGPHGVFREQRTAPASS